MDHPDTFQRIFFGLPINLGRIWSILTDLTENSTMQPSAPALYPFVSLLSKLDQYCSNGVVKILTKNHPKIHEKYQVLSQIWTLNTKCHKIMVGQSERKYRRFWISNHIFENKFPRYDSIFTHHFGQFWPEYQLCGWISRQRNNQELMRTPRIKYVLHSFERLLKRKGLQILSLI